MERTIQVPIIRFCNTGCGRLLRVDGADGASPDTVVTDAGVDGTAPAAPVSAFVSRESYNESDSMHLVSERNKAA